MTIVGSFVLFCMTFSRLTCCHGLLERTIFSLAFYDRRFDCSFSAISGFVRLGARFCLVQFSVLSYSILLFQLDSMPWKEMPHDFVGSVRTLGIPAKCEDMTSTSGDMVEIKSSQTTARDNVRRHARDADPEWTPG